MITRQIVVLTLTLLVCFNFGNSQETTLNHIVTPNETLASIAQIYKVTVEDIQKLNPNIIDGIAEGDVLIIPSSLNGAFNPGSTKYVVKTGDTKYSLARKFDMSISDLERQNPEIVSMLKVGEVLEIGLYHETNNPSKDENSYVVKSGDTKFGLAKKFGFTIDQLEKINPQIVPTLMVGQTIFLSGTDSAADKTNSNTSGISEVTKYNQEPENRNTENLKESNQKTVVKSSKTDQTEPNSYLSHTIQPGETLYGLSKAAGMSIEDFLILNPKLSTSVQAGMVIKLPVSNGQSANTTPTSHFNNIKPKTNYTDIQKTVSKNAQKKLAFLLPIAKKEFFETNNALGFSGDVQNNRDFYRGALIAIDSAKILGLKIDFNKIEMDSAQFSTEENTTAENIHSSDAIILPYLNNNMQGFVAALSKLNIPVVTGSTGSIRQEVSNLFEAVPSAEVQRKIILDYLNSKNDGNLIVLNDENRSESRASIVDLAPEAKFVSVNANGTFNSDKLVEMLQKNSKNYVILDTDKNAVFISATNALLRELSNYQIQLVVLESSLIPDEDDVSRKRFVILDMLYPSITRTDSQVGQNVFAEIYKKKYSIEPSSMSVYGFEITWDTLLRLFQPKDFMEVSKLITEYNTLKFEYLKNDSGYYSNFGVSIFQYETNDAHKKVK